jgi:hypothetical protein
MATLSIAERMERKQVENALWLDLLEKAEAATKARGDHDAHQHDLALLRMAVHELKRAR